MKAHSGGKEVGRKLPSFYKIANLAMTTMGVLVLVCWAFGVRSLIELIPAAVVMNPVTALTFILAGCCFWRLTSRESRDLRALFARVSWEG